MRNSQFKSNVDREHCIASWLRATASHTQRVAVDDRTGSRNLVLACQNFRFGWERTKDYFFTPRIASLAALPTRNFTTVFAGILIFCCVFGFRPIRAFLFCFTNLPKPGRTNSPSFLVAL